jgi:hypothetical protein
MVEDRTGPEDLALPDPVDDYLSLVTLLSSAIPVFGGAVGHVFSEWAAARRAQRLREVLTGIVDDIKALGVRVHEEYVRSDEFEDLLDQTLRRVATERYEEKRRVFRAFLLGAITTPADYDEQVRILRTIDQLQAAHLTVIRAVMEPPARNNEASIGRSFGQVLMRRIGGMQRARIDELVEQLNDLKILNMSIHGMMSGSGAENTAATVTPYGQRMVRYIMEASPK